MLIGALTPHDVPIRIPVYTTHTQIPKGNTNTQAHQYTNTQIQNRNKININIIPNNTKNTGTHTNTINT